MTTPSPSDTASSTAATLSDSPLPRHIAVIMDGNGRWAAQRNLARSEGHKAGTESARQIVEECLAVGVGHLTLYTFSRENWSRPAAEVKFLFELLIDFITKELPLLEHRGVALHILGEMDALPFAARKTLQHACSRTAYGTKMVLNLALNYSGREEIARACRLLMEAGHSPREATPENIARYLYTHGQPDPDLVIRTSGELRTSNFLLFQTAYSEFYFTDTLWPDFTPEELRKAIASYATRSRRFGATTPQS